MHRVETCPVVVALRCRYLYLVEPLTYCYNRLVVSCRRGTNYIERACINIKATWSLMESIVSIVALRTNAACS